MTGSTFDALLNAPRQHLRQASSLATLCSELRSFLALVFNLGLNLRMKVYLGPFWYTRLFPIRPRSTRNGFQPKLFFARSYDISSHEILAARHLQLNLKCLAEAQTDSIGSGAFFQPMVNPTTTPIPTMRLIKHIRHSTMRRR